MICSAVADVIKNDYLCRRMDSCPILTWCKGVRGRSDSGHLFYRSFTHVLHFGLTLFKGIVKVGIVKH